MNKIHIAVFIVLGLSFLPGDAKDLKAELVESQYSGPKHTPCPAVLAAAPTGEVFVGVDQQGSLGKTPGLGKIVRLVDQDADGKPDLVTDFAKVDNPRGITVLGDQVIVLHTVSKDGHYDNQQLSLFVDADWDGVADGPAQPLITNIGNSTFLQSRGADHCTNNIRYAIDGWIYIAVGDFGCVDAEGTDGNKLTMFGGVARVKPDGSGLEQYVSGTRNVYDVAIDPFMNLFARENSNDGIGWWVRSTHFIQSADYGYPNLYTNFSEDILPAMAEYGAGSGVGALYLEEPGWPQAYNKNPLLADWGHSMIYVHESHADGASFTNKVRNFFKSLQVADLDVDGSGRMYVAAWAGAGYKGNPDKGYVSLVVPKDWQYQPFPKLTDQSEAELVDLLKTESITARTYASYELVRRQSTTEPILAIANDQQITLESRVAALYTLAQIQGEEGLPILEQLSQQDDLREHAIRAIANDMAYASKANAANIAKSLTDPNPRVQVAAAIALGRIGDQSVADDLLAVATPPAIVNTSKTKDSKPIVKTKSLKAKEIKQFRKIDVNVEKLSQLVLVVDQNGVNKFDQAAWINPTLHLENGETIDVTELEPLSVSVDQGQFGLNKDSSGAPLKWQGKPVKGLGVHAQSELVYALPEGAKRFTAKGILTPGAKGDGKHSGKVFFAVSENALKPAAELGYIAPNLLRPHSAPNANAILPHVAQKALVRLQADDALIAALDSTDESTVQAALATAKYRHSEKLAKALIGKAEATTDSAQKLNLAKVLIRLNQKEKDYDGTTWWKTRPNPDGPYFTPVDWDGTEAINTFLTSYIEAAEDKGPLVAELKKNKAYVAPYHPRPVIDKDNVVKTIGDTAIEDVVLFLEKYKGKIKNGGQVITKVGCIGCHSIDREGPIKGPDLTKLGNMSHTDMAEAILKPGATIAPSWVNITTKDGVPNLGTVIAEDEQSLTLNNIAGLPTKIPLDQIQKREPGINMMSLHLCDSLTLEEFGDMVAYIISLDGE